MDSLDTFLELGDKRIVLKTFSFFLIFTALLGATGSRADFRADGFDSQLEGYLEHYSTEKSFDPRNLRGDFSFNPNDTAADLYGSVDMLYLLYATGELEDRTTEEGRAEWAKVIQSFQSVSGYFDLGNHTLLSKEHATAYASGALKILGAKPKYHFKWAEKLFDSREHVEKFIDSIDSVMIWNGSHKMGDALSVLMFPNLSNLPSEWPTWMLEGVTARLDSRTGFWQREILPTMSLGGTSHFLWMYENLNQSLPNPEAIIESTLSLQKKSFIWGDWLDNGSLPNCIDLDAVNALHFAYQALSEEKKMEFAPTIILALENYESAAMRMLNRKDALLTLYKDTHKLPGGVLGLAEADIFYRELTGKNLIATRHPWRSVLPTIPWL